MGDIIQALGLRVRTTGRTHLHTYLIRTRVSAVIITAIVYTLRVHIIRTAGRACAIHVCVYKDGYQAFFHRIGSSESNQRKRQVSLGTFHCWQTEKERECQTLSWLRCDKLHYARLKKF